MVEKQSHKSGKIGTGKISAGENKPREIKTGNIKIKRKRKRLYEMLDKGAVPVNDTLTASINQTTMERAAAKMNTSEKKSKKPLKKPISKRALYNFQRDKAKQIIMAYSKYTVGTGLLPVPVLDMIVIKKIGLKLLKKLCILYGVEFLKQEGKTKIDILTKEASKGLWKASLFKFVPVIGLPGGGITMLCKAGRVTYGVGMVFIQHFEAGGTLTDFDPLEFNPFFN
jgi:uncharacterized protein (DUF697 family)